MINISVPELVLSALLDGPSGAPNAEKKGLCLRVEDLKIGMLSGPKDFESTLQVWRAVCARRKVRGGECAEESARRRVACGRRGGILCCEQQI